MRISPSLGLKIIRRWTVARAVQQCVHVMRNMPWTRPVFSVIAGVVVAAIASACASDGTATVNPRNTDESQVARNYNVILVPTTQGGTAGWCLTVLTPDSGTCEVPETSSGPVFAENEACGSGGASEMSAYALTREDAVAVSIAGGRPIPTRTEPMLPRGLRAVFVEIHPRGVPRTATCPKFTALGEDGKAIAQGIPQQKPLARQVPNIVRWRLRKGSHFPRGSHPPRGACGLGPDVVAGFSASEGIVTRVVKPSTGLFEQAFMSCTSTEYNSSKSMRIRAAVLINARRPGQTPAPLPGMKMLAGHPGYVLAPGSAGTLMGRRIHGGWIVVEAGTSRLRIARDLLEHIQASVHI